jgi:hypothetical protein
MRRVGLALAAWVALLPALAVQSEATKDAKAQREQIRKERTAV